MKGQLYNEICDKDEHFKLRDWWARKVRVEINDDEGRPNKNTFMHKKYNPESVNGRA